MLEELIPTQWTRYERLVTSGIIVQAFQDVLPFLDDSIASVVPSIELNSDGPVVKSVFFRTVSYLGEIRLSDKKSDFDFIEIRNLLNFRVQFWENEITRNEKAIQEAQANNIELPSPEILTYEGAKITLGHGHGYRTILNYIGSEREAWLNDIRNMIPLRLMRGAT